MANNMKVAFYRFAFIFLLMNFSLLVLAQQPEGKGFLRSTITVEKLRSAKVIEELIENMPEGYEVVFYRLSLAGKNIMPDWKPDMEKNVLNNTFLKVEAGQRVYIEYIEVKRKGNDSKNVHLQPRELVVID
jgi:hypothetical protein